MIRARTSVIDKHTNKAKNNLPDNDYNEKVVCLSIHPNINSRLEYCTNHSHNDYDLYLVVEIYIYIFVM